MTATDQKLQLRATARAFRRSLSASEHARASRSVLGHLRELREVAGARSVHTFLPAPSLAELNIDPLIDELLDRNVEVIVPLVTHFSKGMAAESVESATVHGAADTHRLQHCRLTRSAKLRTNRWGIREPVDCEPADISSIDVIIVPALACDRRGFRLGFGYGYYDEFLDRTTATKVCPCYDSLLYDSLPIEEHDRPVDIIVTESSILRPNAGKSEL